MCLDFSRTSIGTVFFSGGTVMTMPAYITATALDQWEASAEHDRDRAQSWSVNPQTVLDLLPVLREAAAAVAPHPGEPHRFWTRCQRCGEPGMLNLSLFGPDERVEIRPVDEVVG